VRRKLVSVTLLIGEEKSRASFSLTGQPHQNVLARSREIFAPKTALPTGEPHADPVMDIRCPRNPFAVFDRPTTIAARTVFLHKMN
jgi:hypothetical protein